MWFLRSLFSILRNSYNDEFATNSSTSQAHLRTEN